MIAKLSLVLHDWLSSFNWLFSYSDKYQVRVEVQRKPDYLYTRVKHISLIRSEKTSRFVGINVFNIGIRANPRIRRDEWVKIFDPLNATSQKVWRLEVNWEARFHREIWKATYHILLPKAGIYRNVCQEATADHHSHKARTQSNVYKAVISGFCDLLRILTSLLLLSSTSLISTTCCQTNPDHIRRRYWAYSLHSCGAGNMEDEASNKALNELSL